MTFNFTIIASVQNNRLLHAQKSISSIASSSDMNLDLKREKIEKNVSTLTEPQDLFAMIIWLRRQELLSDGACVEGSACAIYEGATIQTLFILAGNESANAPKWLVKLITEKSCRWDGAAGLELTAAIVKSGKRALPYLMPLRKRSSEARTAIHCIKIGSPCY